MSPSSQQLLESLQAAEHHTKKRLVFLGSVLVMLALVAIWFFSGRIFSDGLKGAQTIHPDFSFWQTVRGGSMLAVQDVGNRFHFISSSLKMPEKSYLIIPAGAGAK